MKSISDRWSCSAAVRRRHLFFPGMRSASNAQRAVEALLERDVIDRDNGSFVIVDRFFRIWIQQRERGKW